MGEERWPWPDRFLPRGRKVWEETSNAVGDAALLGEPLLVQSGIAASIPPATRASLPLSASQNIAVISPVATAVGVATQKPKWTPEQQARIDAASRLEQSHLSTPIVLSISGSRYRCRSFPSRVVDRS